MKTKIKDIRLLISFREIANQYLGKNSKWLYEKIDGMDDHGNPVDPMTDEEIVRFKNALFDVSAKIRSVAESI